MIAKLSHFAISGPNEKATIDFYSELLGWPTDRRGPGYTLNQPDEGPTGAIVEAAEHRVTLGVSVDDLDAAVRQAAVLGGQVLMPPTDNGWVRKALAIDPAGNALSLLQYRAASGR